jgi:Ca2+-binding RTX toxin-like protein
VSLTDMLPAGTTLVQQSQTSGPSFVLGSSPTQVTNTIASLAANASATFTILVRVDGELPRDQQLKNKVTVSSSTSDPKSSNNTSTATTKVCDSTASLHASAADPTKMDLVITGSSKNDTILVDPASGGKVSVKINGKSLGSFSPTNNIVVYGRSGNDTVTVHPQVNRTAILFGGTGNDKLQAGAGNSVLAGGDGIDNLIAGAGRNIVIGGKGANTLNGNLGDNVLVGGSTSFDASQAALEKLLAEWSRTDAAYSIRVDHLRGTLTGGLNDSFALNSTTVVDNESVDKLLAGLGTDWFLADTLGSDADQLPPLQAGELVNAI